MKYYLLKLTISGGNIDKYEQILSSENFDNIFLRFLSEIEAGNKSKFKIVIQTGNANYTYKLN